MRNHLKGALVAGAVVALGAMGFASTGQAYESNSHNQNHMGHGKYHQSHGYKHHKRHGSKHRGHHRSFNGHGYKKLMERFDSDNNKELSQSELDAARKDLLAKHDGDKDGQLTLAEFQALWLEFMHKKMVRSFQHLDQDGDAIITVDEFVAPFSEAVRHMDRNGDGVLNADDRQRAKNDNSSDDAQDEQ